MNFLAQTDVLDDTLKTVERVSAWPLEALNIGLFVLVLFVVWRYLRVVRTDFQKLQIVVAEERKDYLETLKSMVTQEIKVLERNNLIFERVERRLERLETNGAKK